jgi:2-iminobutanoate/2-iminopropanoate deaminase
VPVNPIPTPTQPWVGGPYSGAVRAGDWVVVAGQVGVDPTSGQVVAGDVVAQGRQVFANLEAILTDVGATWADVAKVTIFLGVADPGMMPALNALYLEHVGEHRPARTTVGVAWLPLGTLVEIEVWIYQPEAS